MIHFKEQTEKNEEPQTKPQRPSKYHQEHHHTYNKNPEKESQRIYEELIAENTPNLMKNTNLYFQKDQQTLRINPKKFILRHIMIKLLRTRQRIFFFS